MKVRDCAWRRIGGESTQTEKERLKTSFLLAVNLIRDSRWSLDGVSGSVTDDGFLDASAHALATSVTCTNVVSQSIFDDEIGEDVPKD